MAMAITSIRFSTPSKPMACAPRMRPSATEKSSLRLVMAESGASFAADLVILAIGVRPESELAKIAGLRIGSRGGIVVDPQMRTSDPLIWAVGDVVEVPDIVTGQDTVLPL